MADNTQIITTGGLSFDDAEPDFVPVDIRLLPDNPDNPQKWILSANLYRPSQNKIFRSKNNSFREECSNPELLRRIVREKVIPLYNFALKSLKLIAEGKGYSLHQWADPNEWPP